jgi:peptidoglycan/xylan/chitin deacetylase (PgdA/CDA1 family)
VLSFDDGYASQVRNAQPELRRAGWPGVLNLTLANLPRLGGVSAVRRMVRAGWEVDSHTLTHPDLTTLADGALRRELRDSRARIRRLFGESASFFCYPSGRYDARVIAAVKDAGYLAATTVISGFATPAADPYLLERIQVSAGVGGAGLLRRLRELRPS